MNQSYKINLPAKIIFGPGSRHELIRHLPDGQGRYLLITGSHFARSNEAEKMLSGLNFISIVMPNGEPDLAALSKIMEQVKNEKFAGIIAAGGGSAIDGGKALSVLIPQGGDIRDYFYGRMPFNSRKLFFAALPTTSGTGAEITANAVLTDEKNLIKQSLRAPDMTPNLAIVDSELCRSCSKNVIAASGLDSLTQALEGIISRNANAYSQSLAIKAFDLIFANLRQAWNYDFDAMDKMAEGTMLGAMAFGTSGLGAVHGLAHPLGSLLKLPHGVVCGILLIEVMKLNSAALEKITPLLQCRLNATQLITELENLRSAVNIPANFHNFNLKTSDFDFILKNCRSGSMKCNPIDLSDAQIIKLLEKLS